MTCASSAAWGAAYYFWFCRRFGVLQRPAGSAGVGGSFGIPSVLQDASCRGCPEAANRA